MNVWLTFARSKSLLPKSPIPLFLHLLQVIKIGKIASTHVHIYTLATFFAVLLLGLYHYTYHTRIALGHLSCISLPPLW